MSQPEYYSYEGMGQHLLENHHYNQAVRVGGNYIEVSGQGGWDPVTKELKKDKFEEIDQVFKNVDLVLKDAGGKGWSQVYRVRSFHTDMSHDTLMYVVNKLKEWNPGPKPVFTCVGVTKLGIEGMNLEMEVSAYDDEADTGSKAKPGA